MRLFLAFFDLLWKRFHVIFIGFDYIALNYKTFFYLHGIYMSKKSINFSNKKINKSNFYKNKRLFKIDDTDVDKILVTWKES